MKDQNPNDSLREGVEVSTGESTLGGSINSLASNLAFSRALDGIEQDNALHCRLVGLLIL